jgi:hypothetical protein
LEETKEAHMRGKILFVAGLAAGYVVGARAGRPAYEAVVERVQGIAGSDRAKRVGAKAKQTLEEKAPKVADVAEKAASSVSDVAAAAKDAGAAADDSAADDSTASSTESAGSGS